MHAGFDDALPIHDRATGNTAHVEYLPMGPLMKKLGEGAATDVIVVTEETLPDARAKGLIVSGTETEIGRVMIGVCVREGAPSPDISTPEALKATLLAAKSIVYIDPKIGTSGKHLAEVFKQLGILDQVKAKAATVKPNEPVGEVIARGEAEIGFQQISELVPVKGIQYVGPLPAELQNVTLFTGGVLAGAKEAAAAKVLVDFLTTPAAMQSLKAHGLEPG